MLEFLGLIKKFQFVSILQNKSVGIRNMLVCLFGRRKAMCVTSSVMTTLV